MEQFGIHLEDFRAISHWELKKIDVHKTQVQLKPKKSRGTLQEDLHSFVILDFIIERVFL